MTIVYSTYHRLLSLLCELGFITDGKTRTQISSKLMALWVDCRSLGWASDKIKGAWYMQWCMHFSAN